MSLKLNIQEAKSGNGLANLLATAKKVFPFLHYVALIHLGLFLLSLLAILIDPRELAGINVWIKPAKFLASTFIFLWTIAWFLPAYPFSKKIKTWIANSFTILLSIENIIISMQAGRGIPSHYNESSLLNGLLFGLMGIAIGLITLLIFGLFISSFSSKLKLSWSMKWGLRIAWFAFLFASMVGSIMIQQRGHNVGIADGGVGLPFVNWSTQGGDLRIAHFFGLHAIQVIPLAIYFITSKLQRQQTARILSIMFAIFYLVWIVFIFYQAKMGQALITS